MVADGGNVKITHLTGNLEFQDATQIKKPRSQNSAVLYSGNKNTRVHVLLPEYLYIVKFS